MQPVPLRQGQEPGGGTTTRPAASPPTATPPTPPNYDNYSAASNNHTRTGSLFISNIKNCKTISIQHISMCKCFEEWHTQIARYQCHWRFCVSLTSWRIDVGISDFHNNFMISSVKMNVYICITLLCMEA